MTLTDVENAVKHWVTFIKGHERLVIIVGVGILLFHFGEKGLAAWEAHDARQANIAQQQVNSDKATNVALAQQLAELKIQVDGVTALAKQAILQKHEETKKQQQVDQNLPLPELGNRWVTLLQPDVKPTDIQVAANNSLTVNENAARVTVKQLETIPDMLERVVQTDAELAGCNQVRQKQDETIVALNKTVDDTNKARVEDAKVAKDAQRKAGRKWFKIGFVTGAGTVIAAKIALLFI